MSWPPVASHIYVTGELDDAATRNTFVKDALLDLDRRTSPTAAAVDTHATTALDVYGDLSDVGPAVAVNLGLVGLAVVSWSGLLGSNTAGNGAWMSVAMSGAFTLAASDAWALNYTPGSPSVGGAFGITRYFPCAPGLVTFTSKYRLELAGGGIEAFADHRAICAQPLGS